MMDIMLGILIRVLRVTGDLVLYHGVLGYSLAYKRWRLVAGLLLLLTYIILPATDFSMPYIFWVYCAILVAGSTITFQNLQSGMAFFVFTVRMLIGNFMDGVLQLADVYQYNDVVSWQKSICIVNLVYLTLCMLYGTVFKNKIRGSIILKLRDSIIWICSIAILLSSTSIVFGTLTAENIRRAEAMLMVRNCTFGFAVTGLVATIFILLETQRKLNEQKYLNEKCILEQTEQYRLLNEKQQMLRSFRHDLNGHLLVLRRLASENKTEQLREHLEKWGSMQREVYIISTNHVVGDAIFNHYYSLGEKENVEVRILGKFPDALTVSETDLCVVLTNVISNAYEAAVKCEKERCVSVEIGQFEGKLLLIIKNSVCRQPVIADGIMQTTKEDKFEHGLGIKNTMQTLKKYGGDIAWEYEADTVTTKMSF